MTKSLSAKPHLQQYMEYLSICWNNGQSGFGSLEQRASIHYMLSVTLTIQRSIEHSQRLAKYLKIMFAALSLMIRMVIAFLIYSTSLSYSRVVDVRMIQAALIPFSNSSQFAVEWLRQYFDTYGDHIPNSDEIRLSQVSKVDVYEDFLRDCKNYGTHDDDPRPLPAVSYTTFVELWNCIFPHCVIRSFVDIPGKCFVCGEVERIRTCCESTAEAEAASKVHFMHRGGMFMLERAK